MKYAVEMGSAAIQKLTGEIHRQQVHGDRISLFS
jgi:hypothetical protein